MRNPLIRHARAAAFLLLLSTAVPSWSAAETPSDLPFLSPIFGDNMVLQRGKPNTFWGWAQPGQSVHVQIGASRGESVAGADGKWQAQVEPPAEPGECTVAFDGPQHVELHHVVVGDVWLCGGQSNMQFALHNALDGDREVAAADHPVIRFFTVGSHAAYAPAAVPKGEWKVCTPASVVENGGLSAVAYYFACRVQRETGVPIGLVVDCLGGTPVESWMDPATLASMKDFDPPMAEVERLRKSHAPEYGNYIMHWYDDYDEGSRGKTWADDQFDDRSWKEVPVPGAFEALGLADFPSVVWMRREVTLPDPLPPGDATLYLGVVEKMDTAFINGHWVGASSWVENPRVYRVAREWLKPGRNLVTVRVLKLKSKGGFEGGPESLHLKLQGGADIPLAGVWRAAESVDARPPHPMPLGYENYPTMPSVLYDGMIHPLVPLALKGAIWYQGEANARRAHQYRTLLPAMIRDWRAAFGQGDFPFIIAGLPAFEARKSQPGDDEWAELREAQALTAGSVPNTGLAVTIDTGEAANIHPKEKKPVGDRLAGVALTQWYGKPVPFSGPVFRAAERVGGSMHVTFDHTEGGLRVHGEELGEFSVAGSDRQWHWAQARIDHDTVWVSSPEVPEPQAVRYAWQANPKANLFNGDGLPARPFRSDDWPGVTDRREPW